MEKSGMKIVLYSALPPITASAVSTNPAVVKILMPGTTAKTIQSKIVMEAYTGDALNTIPKQSNMVHFFALSKNLSLFSFINNLLS